MKPSEELEKTVRAAARSVSEGLGGKNPLLVRKKFDMKDVYFRKDAPDVELFRFEMGGDMELWVLALGGALLAALLIRRILRIGRRMRARREEE